MKLRVINQNGLFVPQHQKTSYYSSTWVGFGTPTIKFSKKEQALKFVEMVDESVGGKVLSKKNEVVYTNYAPEGKI